jgi:hypothetical protein
MKNNVEINYTNYVTDTLDFDYTPSSFTNTGGVIYFDDDNSHFFVINLEHFIRAKISYPNVKLSTTDIYSAEIKYSTEDEDVELLLSSSCFYVDIIPSESGSFPSLVVLKKSSNPVRIINSAFLKCIKVSESKAT